MANVIRIQLGKKDSIVAAWRKEVMDLQERGLLSYITKYAISNYITTGKHTCIGKIHKSQITNISNNESIPLYLDNSPQIKQWIDNLSAQGIPASKLIREILRLSIQIIPEEKEEWIPSFLDIDILKNSSEISFSSISNIPTLDILENEQVAKPQINKPIPKKNTSGIGHKPKAASLFGNDDFE